MGLIKNTFIVLIKGLFSVLLLLIIASAIVIALEIRVNLSQLNKPIEIAIEKVLDRDFSMQGDVVLIPTLWPTLEIHDISISNPEGQQWKTGKNLAQLGRLRLQLGILALLSGKIYIADITAQDITLQLESDKKGNSNWDFDISSETSKATKNQAELNTDTEQLFHFEALDKIVFKNINIHYLDQLINKPLHFNLQQLKGSASPDEDINLEFNGTLQDKEYSVKLKGGGIELLRNKSQPWPLNMSIEVAGTDIELSGELTRGKNAKLTATLEVGKTDIGATLAWFNIMHGLQIGSENLTIKASLKGKSLTSLLRDAELDIILQNAWWNLADKNTGAKLGIKITEGIVKIEPQKAIQVELDGLLDQSKINILVSGAPLLDYIAENSNTPLALDIKTHGTNLQLKTLISKSIDTDNLSFDMIFKGKKLNDLNQLSKMDLPPLGPYRLSGTFSVDQQGYQISHLLLKVQESQLSGNMLMNTQVKPPSLNIDLKSKLLQINHFDVGDWTAADKAEDPDESKAEQQINTKENKQQARKLLSFETLSRFNVDINLDFDNVMSGKDSLGKGSASLTLDKAKLNLKISELVLPGGNASADFIYHPSSQKDLDIALKMRIKNFDYGILARRIDEKSEVAGLISLDINLSSDNAKNIDSLLINSQGHLDFAWIPESMDADLFEMWAVNLISSLLKKSDKDQSSKVNCVIARLSFDQGMMREKVIFADTTKMRMAGTAEANFKDRTIKVKVAPKAKKAEFFSLATPVGVEGSFDDFNLSINPLGLTKTIVSFITSPLHVPVRRLFKKGLPEDGLGACKAMWEASNELEGEKNIKE